MPWQRHWGMALQAVGLASVRRSGQLSYDSGDMKGREDFSGRLSGHVFFAGAYSRTERWGSGDIVYAWQTPSAIFW